MKDHEKAEVMISNAQTMRLRHNVFDMDDDRWLICYLGKRKKPVLGMDGKGRVFEDVPRKQRRKYKARVPTPAPAPEEEFEPTEKE